jgi:hypothetical protein
MSKEVKDALDSRLGFRASFLGTVEAADLRTVPEQIKTLWDDLLKLVPSLKSTTKLGKPVPASFSVKIQRKLASTVPPRPIVQISQEAAFDHFERLCRGGSVAVEVLKYYDSHSLMVHKRPLFVTAC